MKKIILLRPFRKKGNYQFFMDWFADAWQSCGGRLQQGYSIPWTIRLMVAKSRLSRNCPILSSKREALLVLGAGYPDSFAWPHSYTHEIIPMLWDVWPRYWSRLISSLKRHHVRTFLCTSDQVCEYVRELLPHIHVIHVPEGINPSGYLPGENLQNRTIDILELGRQLPSFHQSAISLSRLHPDLKHMFSSVGSPLLFPDFGSLCLGLASSKITVSYPRCDTHPEMAGNVETLTQRYWECMLSRTLIVGRAPQELIDLVGYNPVIEIFTHESSEQIYQILKNIDSYQNLVNKNYHIAQQLAPWSARCVVLKSQLNTLGYNI